MPSICPLLIWTGPTGVQGVALPRVAVTASRVRSSSGSNWSHRGVRAPGQAAFPLRFRRRVVFETSELARIAEPPWRIVNGVRKILEGAHHGRRPGTAGRAGRPIDTREARIPGGDSIGRKPGHTGPGRAGAEATRRGPHRRPADPDGRRT